jgi:DNA-directed RNA polymerase subunit RPC12/RpoP
MLKCYKCNKRMFLDRQYTKIDYLEIYCMSCGSRRFFNPPTASREGQWLLEKEKLRAKATISPL